MAKKKTPARKRPGPKPLEQSIKRTTISIVVAPKTEALVRKMARSNEMTMGRMCEYLLLLGVEYMSTTDEHPTYEALEKIDFDVD